MMASDEHGMPVPSYHSPLPWAKCEHYGYPKDANAGMLISDFGDFYNEDDCDFSLHAANNIIECREIVRRLAEWHDDGSSIRDVMKISGDAARLWAKMQKDAKGGDGEGSV